MTEHFVHLHVHSAYSLAEGAIKVKDLVKLCAREKMPAVAVTDTNNLFGAMEFALEAAKSGIQPILGCQVCVDAQGHQLTLLVQNERGYKNLSKIISNAYMQDNAHNEVCAPLDHLAQYGLICLSGGMKGSIAQSVLHEQIQHAEDALKRLHEIFGDRFYIELQRHNLPDEDKAEEGIITLAYKHNIPLVATNDCYFKDRAAHEAHDALYCRRSLRYRSGQAQSDAGSLF